MEHEEKIHLARSISTRVVAQQPGNVVVSGVYGSTARGTDTTWSDLEMLFIMQSASMIQSRLFLYRGMPVGLSVWEQSDLEYQLANPDFGGWGYSMGILDTIMVLHGDPEQVLTWLQLGQSVPPAKFREALEANLSWIIHEPLGRIKSCLVRGNEWDIGNAVMEMLSAMLEALCLLNQRWTTHSSSTYQGFVETFDFTKLPKGYRDLIPALWSAREMNQIVSLAEKLVNNFWQLLADEDLKLPIDYQAIEDLPL